MPLKPMILALATTTTGLVTGVFYGFSVAINPALARLPDRDYITTMQIINKVIQNPLFAGSFVGAPLLLPWATALHMRRLYSRRVVLLGAATMVYTVGSLGVTLAVNIPLNEQLAAFPTARATPAETAAARTAFATPWNRWHLVRTLASTAAFLLTIGACLCPPSAPRAT
ncbi:anthrone oxygenase family protein [Hymenobacter metallicola]|uniref:DUF1772 domain-containing protein n=1 Tax=Hymenobacter metallicola TaxID=2563114 RepID=A0A4Z0QD98_9BACT|nr:anthrone oxygenase family protein [Hymenobacter metallicola]TGE27715.1 DUF1772 domain-containing protein [Hymenobacter metallicola]